MVTLPVIINKYLILFIHLKVLTTADFVVF